MSSPSRFVSRMSLLLFLGAVAIASLPATTAAEPVGERLESVRLEAQRLRADVAGARVSALETGKPWPRVALFAERQELLSRATLDFLRERRAAAADSSERQLLDFLEVDIARWMLLAAVAPIDDRIAALGGTLKAEVEDVDNSLTLNELTARIPVEGDSLHRRMLLAARAGLWAEHIDPLLRVRTARQDSLARALGFPNHTALAARSIGVADVREVVAQLLLFVRGTDSMYRLLAGEFAGVPERRALAGRSGLTTTALDAFHRRTEFDAMFRGYEAELWSRAVSDLGLQLPVVGRSAAFLAPPGLPDLVAAPEPGVVPALVAEWRARGAKFHRLRADDHRVEFLESGPATLPGATGELVAGLLTNPAWLRQWRETSALADRQEPARWGDPSIARYVRWRLWCELDRIRVDLAATLLQDLVVHDAGEEAWGPFFLVPPSSDPRELWRQLLGDARDIPATVDDAWDHTLRAQPHLAAAESARALGLAATVEEALVRAHGEEWFRQPAARRALQEELYRESTAVDADALARAWGESDLNLEPLRRRFERLFEWSEEAGGGPRR